MKRLNFKRIFLAAVILSVSQSFTPAYAQLNLLGSSYYWNTYLNNPAMVGQVKGLSFDITHRQQWNMMPGSPVTQSLSGSYGTDKRVALGMNIHNDKAGLQRWTRVLGTYAYKLPLNIKEDALHLGVSFGYSNEKLNNQDIIADPDDASIGRYNDRESYLDGDFGVAYTTRGLSVEGAIPNLKSFFYKDNPDLVDRAVFFSAMSYKFYLGNQANPAGIEPKVVFRGIKGYDNIIDIGTNVSLLDNQLQLMTMYHTTGSFTSGFGFTYKTISIYGIYTSETSDINGYTNGNFELNLKLIAF
jgi:type IX secretion system PorP/SprF family membrane protein